MKYEDMLSWLKDKGFDPKVVQKIELTPAVIVVHEYRTNNEGNKYIVGMEDDPFVQAGGYTSHKDVGGSVGDMAIRQVIVAYEHSYGCTNDPCPWPHEGAVE